jgi:hypothetical protein
MSPVSRRGGRGSRCPSGAERRMRHRGEEEDATPDLLLKYSDVTLATYV